VGVRVGVANFFLGQSIDIDKNNTFQLKFVFYLEWAWHPAETNLRCVRTSGICMPSLNGLALIVSEKAFIRTDGQMDMARSTSDPDEEYIYFMGSESLPSPTRGRFYTTRYR